MWNRISFAKKILFGGIAAVGLLAVIGAANYSPPPSQKDTINLTKNTATKGAATTAPKKTAVTTKEITSGETIPFTTTTIDDPALDAGQTKVTVAGVNGIRTKTYKVTLTDGKETNRELIKDEITRQPVAQVVAKGTHAAQAAAPSPNCDPNYSGACVPIASDVDCASGSGNGPAYVAGPVQVIGRDIYGLDRDGDGIGCEN